MSKEKTSAAKQAKVTEENREESRRLRELWDAWKKTDKALSQTVFGERFGVGSQAYVGFCLNGESPISLKAAIGFARGLGCSIADFSPRLAREASKGADVAVSAAAPASEPGQPIPLRARLSVRDLVLQLRDAMLAVGPHQRQAVLSNLSALVDSIHDSEQVNHIAGLVEMTLAPPASAMDQAAANGV